MKLSGPNIKSNHGLRAFTLAEALVTSATLIIIIGSVIMCNLFGLAMAVRQQIWLGASDDSAQCVGTLMSDIRSATAISVGTFSNGVFTPVAAGVQQSGNALMIATNTPAPTGAALWSAPWTLYYYDGTTDATSNSLIRSNFYTSATGDWKLVSANPITNDVTHPIFTQVDYTGTPLTNATPLSAISIYLSFTKLQDPEIVIEDGSSVDLYQIITVVSPRLRL